MVKDGAKYDQLAGEVEYENGEAAFVNSNPHTLFADVCSFEGGVNLQEMLTTINNRIAVLLSNDYQIGHSYFINCFSLEQLKETFHKNIIPLLQEYFYGDYGKIGLVLGEGFVELFNTKNNQNIFAKFGNYDTDSFIEKPVYRIKNIAAMTEEEFQLAINKLIAVG